MKSQTSIKKNFIYQMIYQILIIILPFVTSPYIARTIGAEGLGTYSYSYSIAYYFVLFSMLGLANYGNRAVAQCRDNQKNLNETFSNIVTLHIAFSFICCVVYILYVFFLANEKLYAGIQFTYVLSGLFDVSWFYFGIEKFKLTVTRNIIIKILNVVCVFVFVRNANDLWTTCFSDVHTAYFNPIIQFTTKIPLKEPLKMILSKIHHIAIIVSNYETAKDFYVNKLNFPIIRENYRPERNDWKLDLRVNEYTELEIFAEPDPPKRVNRPEACGLRHLAFCVESVEQTVKELAEVGIDCEPIRVDAYTGKKMTFFQDPDGLPLELHE